MSDGQGFVSMIDTTDPLPCGVDFTDGQGNNLKAQWRAHELAITDLHWIKVTFTAVLKCRVINTLCTDLSGFAGRHADDHCLR